MYIETTNFEKRNRTRVYTGHYVRYSLNIFLWRIEFPWKGIMFRIFISTSRALFIPMTVHINMKMDTQHWRNNIYRGKPKYLAKNIFKCHFVFHRSFSEVFDHRLNPTNLLLIWSYKDSISSSLVFLSITLVESWSPCNIYMWRAILFSIKDKLSC